MEPRRFLAFDFGAESGRAVVGTLDGRRLSIEEIYRFPNEPVEICGTLHWDVLALYNHILKGLRAYVERYGSHVESIGVDTWGVDFGLLARDGSLLQNPVHYRDKRTTGIAVEMERRISMGELFERTGMSFSPIWSLCQLLALRLRESPVLESADTFLMMPDLLNYFLTGRKCCERTNAINTLLYDPVERGWIDDFFPRFGVPRQIMPELVDPGTVLGELRPAVGLDHARVIAPCTHDTASAVAAVPACGDDWAFLSSGTWSALGAPTRQLVTSPAAAEMGICNEVGLEDLFVCRNIMGLWLLQQARRSWQRDGQSYTYPQLVELARQAPPDGPLIHPNDPGFLAPADMNAAIRDYCLRTDQRAPEGPGPTTRCILESLALCYRQTIERLSEILGRRFRVLHAVGGGSLNTLLCQFTANATGLPLVAGPVEATVIGNLLTQALACGYLASPGEIREVVRQSTDLVQYDPAATAFWEDRFDVYLGRSRVA